MDRTGRSSLAWLALAGMIGGAFLPAAYPVGGFAAIGHAGDLDPLGHGCAYALPPPDLCCLCPLLDEPIVELSRLAGPDTFVTDDGYSLPFASRGPPEQA